MSLAEAKQIFSCTLEGKLYSLPCPASELADAGWRYGTRNHSNDGDLYDPGKGLGGVYLTLGDVNEYGWADKQVFISFLNKTDAPATWNGCTLMGMRMDKNQTGHNAAEFLSGVGIGIDDPDSKVIERFGHWNSKNEASNSSDSFRVYVEDGGRLKDVGHVDFERKDGVVTQVDVELSYVHMDLFE